ncbi:hypothetical protein SAMN05216402_0235 [Nitrosospira multiformis]|uniref:Uncharacterized protein n=1 Tax=Nitrosospira multiformis TaxID=1231 RepID=A0ABY0TB36_9PROT|nr:hypothetical protein SAMN05216402_0235 [Nitrosospira multiformis]
MSILDSYNDFLSRREKALRRIVNNTFGYMTIDDIQSEVWVIAFDIEAQRGYSIDFTNSDDQETILGALYNRLVKFADKQTRYAIKLDEGWDSEDSDTATNLLALLLAAPPESDPLVWLQQKEDSADFLELIRSSYSEASAYVLLLMRFDWNVEDAAEYLHIVVDTLRRRLKLSGVRARTQPSLFDRIEFIDPDFMPQQARRFRNNNYGVGFPSGMLDFLI